jgi:uncharacterized protein (TIGR01732 family)
MWGYEEGGRGKEFHMLVVLFVLLIIVGASFSGGY